jgi:membrane protein required for colicin V production
VNWVDISLLSSMAAGTLTGLYWGLIRQVASLAGLVGGIFFAGRLYQPVAEFLHGPNGTGLVADPNWARIIAFGGVVIGVSLLVGLLGSVLRFVANLIFLGWLDHVLGGVLGLATSILLAMPMLIVATVFPVPNVSEAVRQSQVAQWLGGFIPVVLAMLPPEFQNFRPMMGWGPF